MKRSVHLLAAAAALALGASLAAQNVPEIAYDANADLLKLGKALPCLFNGNPQRFQYLFRFIR